MGKPKDVKNDHGGKRAGAGRKPSMMTSMKKAIAIKVNDEQKDGLESFIAEKNKEREAKGKAKVDLSTWLRELGLKHAGLEHLGAAAQARAKAEDASSIL